MNRHVKVGVLATVGLVSAGLLLGCASSPKEGHGWRNTGSDAPIGVTAGHGVSERLSTITATTSTATTTAAYSSSHATPTGNSPTASASAATLSSALTVTPPGPDWACLPDVHVGPGVSPYPINGGGWTPDSGGFTWHDGHAQCLPIPAAAPVTPVVAAVVGGPPAAVPVSGALPNTGTDWRSAVVTGLLLIGFGGLFLLARRDQQEAQR